MSTISASTTSTTAYKVTADTTGTLVLQTGSTPTTAVTIDASQNVGLGVTPSAWGSGYKALDIQYLGISNTGAGTVDCSFTQNGYYNGTNWIAKYTSPSKRYSISDSGFIWYNGASATAGNAITFTQAMTLDASGRLIIGNTSPTSGYQLSLGNTSNTSGDISGIVLQEPGASAQLSYFKTTSQASSDTRTIIGNNTAARSLAFETGGTERARIDSSGNLLVGVTSGSSLITATGSRTGQYVVWARNTANTNGDGGFLSVLGSNTVNTTSYHYVATTYGGSDKMYIFGNGNIVNVNNSYGALSDVKLKENITDATPKLNGLMQVRVVNYNLKTDPEHKQLGVVAQELEQVFPSMVDETPDYETVTTTDEEGNETTDRVLTGTTTKSVKYSVFVPMLIKAMQEQQAIIETLTNRITALETK